MSLINSEIKLILTWSVLFLEMQVTDTKLYVPVKNLSTQDNAKLLEQLKSTFKGRID